GAPNRAAKVSILIDDARTLEQNRDALTEMIGVFADNPPPLIGTKERYAARVADLLRRTQLTGRANGKLVPQSVHLLYGELANTVEHLAKSAPSMSKLVEDLTGLVHEAGRAHSQATTAESLIDGYFSTFEKARQAASIPREKRRSSGSAF